MFKPYNSTLTRRKGINPISAKTSARNEYYHYLVHFLTVYRAHNKCELCGRTQGLQGHHITPRARGGIDLTDNIIILCPHCHNHDRFKDGIPITPDEARKIVNAKPLEIPPRED